MIKFWFILFATFISLEIINPGLFFFLALSAGSLATMTLKIQEIHSINEYSFFFIVSGITFILLTIINRYIQNKKSSKFYASNTDLMIGKTTEIVQVLSDDTAYGLVDNEMWLIKMHTKDVKPCIGMKALVVGVKGCHLQVTVIQNN